MWGYIVPIVGLDLTLPFYEDMGLFVSDKSQFLSTLRSVLVIEGKRSERTLVEQKDISKSFELICDNVGGDSALALRIWAEETFFWVHTDQPQWSAWMIITGEKRLLRDSLRLAPEQLELAQNLRIFWRADDLLPKFDVARQKALSEWDRVIFEDYLFSTLPESERESLPGVIDPLLIISSTIEMYRFQRGWPGFIGSLSEGERLRLWEEGEKLLHDFGVVMAPALVRPDLMISPI